MIEARQIFRAGMRKGFTLLELLIVISVIAVLATLVIGVASQISARKKRILAVIQVKGIEEAAKLYFQDFGVYPPDTGEYETDDPLPSGLSGTEATYGIMRYLGIKLVDTKSGATHGPYLNLQEKFLKGDSVLVDGKNVQMLIDPWGNPYEMDCMHVTIDKAARKIGKPSYPYPTGTPEDQCVLEVKVWSKGPDGKSTPTAPFVPLMEAADDNDNVMSWTNIEKSKAN